MRIKQKLHINTAVTVLSAIALIAVLLATAQRVISAMEQNVIADRLMTAQFERLAIRTDYLHTGSERARMQVMAKNEQVGELLKSAVKKFNGSADQKTVAALMEDQEAVAKIFRAIVANRQDAGPQGWSSTLSGEIEARLLNQLNMRVYESVLLGVKLQGSTHGTLVSAIGTGIGWIAFVFVLMGTVTMINSWTMNRTIAARIGRLRSGAAVIGEGDLDHEIGITGNDEFTELSEAFNAMTAKLRGSYHDIEREVEERKQAEEALRKAHDELERRVEERTEELKEANESLERRVAERTAELQAANTKLLDSRRAALNMMEDAHIARKRAEEVNADMLREILERKQAEERLSSYYRRQDLLAETASQLLASHSPQDIVDSLCRKVLAFLDCHVFFNFLMDDDAGRLHLNACAGIPEEEKQKIEWLDYGVAVCGCAARDACRIVAEDIPNTPDPRTDLVKSYGIQAYACHPLMAQGRVLGTLSFGTRTRTGFSDDDLSLMKAVADQVAIAMERKRVEEELRRAKDTAEASTRAKSQFLANMSHELRTPMTGVLGMLDLALGTHLDERQKECISTANNSARSLLRIINDILDLTKIEAGVLSIVEKPFNIRECVSCAIETLGTLTMHKNIELVQTVAADLPPTMVGDQLRLRQVLLNMIGNAVKFTEAGRVEVRVTAGDLGPDGKREISFSVSDTGIGIPADKKHLLFNPFSQVDDSDTRGYGGSGLGLVISKEIVELMGGSIAFESEEGVGSTFTFRIPLAEAQLECGTVSVSEKTDAMEIVTGLPVEGEKSRLLLAEDDPVIRKVLKMMLVRANFDVDFAENGRMAVEMWEQGEYSLILMDVQMPLLDGFAATRIIREKEQARGGHTLIVAMTAHALKKDEERCFAAGMDAYIPKPIDLKKSIEIITDLLTRKNPSM